MACAGTRLPLVDDDHHDGEHRVACDRGRSRWPKHDRGDEDHVNENDGQRQNQRTEWFSELVSQLLGLVDDSERGDHDRREDDQKHAHRDHHTQRAGDKITADRQHADRD